MKKRRKLILAVLAILLAVLIILPLLAIVFTAGAVTQAEINELQEQADELAERQREITEKLDAIADEKEAISARQALLDERINTTYEEIENYNAQVALLDSRIAFREKELARRIEEENTQTELFRRRVRAMEESGTISYYAILFDSASFADLLSRIDDINEVISYNEYVVQGLKDAQLATKEAREQLAASKVEVEAARTQQEQKKLELDIQVADMQKLMITLEANREEFELTYEENAKLEDELTEQIAELQRQYDEEQERLRRLAEEANKQNQQQGQQNYEDTGVIESTGSYIWPVNDSRRCVTSPFGSRLHPILGYVRPHNGIDIGTWYGCGIFAADSGVVTTATYDSSYGNYIMIAHGNGRYTLYGHMSSLAVSKGDYVSKGQTIGYAGSTGLSNGNHLHFEVWVSGTRVDPLSYFSSYWAYWNE